MSTPPPDPGPAADDTIVSAPNAGPEPRRRRSRAPKLVGGLLAAAVLAAVGLYLVGYLMAGDRLPKNAQVSGVAVGGLDRAAGAEKLRTSLQTRAEQPIPVTVAGRRDEVSPAQAGLTVDYERSVAAAGGGKSFDPRQIWGVLTGGRRTEAVVAVDRSRLDSAVADLAAEHEAEPKSATLKYAGASVKTTPAVPGVTLDRAAAAAQLEEAYFVSTAPVELTADVTQPDITDDDVDTLVADFAKPAVAAPVTVRAGDAGSFEVSPTMIAKSVTFVSRDGTLVPKLDRTELFDRAESALSSVEGAKPKDATVRLVGGKPTVIPAVDGTEVSAENLAKAVEPALTKSGDDRTVSIELTGAKAKFSTADAEKLGVKEVTGQFTTYFPYANYRNVNIGRAAELINGTVLKPGETFSLNGVVGERTKANGFTEGNIITGGKFRLELGGGVSQSATTTYNAMFFAGLTDIEHQPHTLYIDRYPPGREATVAWPNLDLRFRNDTLHGVLVQADLTKAAPGRRGALTVKMWSTKTYDKIESSALARSNFTTGRNLTDDSPKCQEMSPVRGFDVNYSRLFHRDNKVVKTEKFFWRYAPTDRVRCTGEPQAGAR